MRLVIWKCLGTAKRVQVHFEDSCTLLQTRAFSATLIVMTPSPQVRFLVFDVESVADGALVSKLRYPGQGLSPQEAIRKYRDELLAKYESDFIPYTFQFPISVIVAKVASDLSLIDVVALDDPQFRPHVITEHFWRGWEHYKRPTLVTFNGRSFDLPLLELAAFRYGINLQRWFNLSGKSFEQPRNRYNTEFHLDVHDVLTNFGAARFNGGLNLAASILGKPGKMEVQGYMVQDLYDAGKLAEINDYCRCDVLDTYFVFLRACVMLGNISLAREKELVDQAKNWLIAKSETCPAYRAYLERWGDWVNPW
jgi:predicted PolB exonuclease-like 3'-5' exonuclease